MTSDPVLEGLPVISFRSPEELRTWLHSNHDSSAGVWVRLRRSGSPVPSVRFDELLEEGLCYGWSESSRRAYDGDSYVQRFTPRRTRGTTSERNRRLAADLVAQGRMTTAGLDALGLTERTEGTADR